MNVSDCSLFSLFSPLMHVHIIFFIFCTEEEEVVDNILRDRSHIEETLRLAADENAGDYVGKEYCRS